MTVLNTDLIRPAGRTNRATAALRQVIAWIVRRDAATSEPPAPPRHTPPSTSADAATRLYNLANGARLRR